MIIDLEKTSGLKIKYDTENFRMDADPEITLDRFSVRTFGELKPYLKNHESGAPGENIYYMYRNFAKARDKDKIAKAGLRYDITVIPPGIFEYKGEREFFKTAGHYHPVKKGTSTAYPELYEVLYGNALWIMQKPDAKDLSKIIKLYVVGASAGEKALMLSGFGHVTVNAGNEPLIMANWVADNFESIYDPYKKRRGAAVWVMKKPEGKKVSARGGQLSAVSGKIENNTFYDDLPKIKKLRSREMPELGLYKNKPMYELVNDLSKLKFLTHPEEFKKILIKGRCYK